MIQHLRKIPGCWVVAFAVILTGLMGGCQTDPKPSNPPAETSGSGGFHVGDIVTVVCTSQTGDDHIVPPAAVPVNEDGNITLSLIGSVHALGKNAGELQKTIHDLYVPKYFPELGVAVRGEGAFFFVDGEVFQRGQKDYLGQMTIVKAIAAAGGFTDFAKQNKVRLTHGNKTKIVNVKKAIVDPTYDVQIYPGDKIYVPRRLF